MLINCQNYSMLTGSKDENGRFIWPGFGENSVSLNGCRKSIGQGKAVKTPIGYMPSINAIDIQGINISEDDMKKLLNVNADEWLDEVASIREYYKTLGEKLPSELVAQLEALEERLKE